MPTGEQVLGFPEAVRGTAMADVKVVRLREFLGLNIWLVPGLLVAAAVILALFLPEVDEATTVDLTFAYSVGAATELLSAIAGGMIVFTGFVFSVVLLLVQFGSSQYSPRLLRTFVHARTPKLAMGTFVATFTYALLVLSSIESASREGFVPSLSVTLALVFLLFSVIMFLLLMQSAYQGLRPGSLTRMVARQGRHAIDAVHPEVAGEDEGGERANYREKLGEPGRVIRRQSEAAVLQAVDEVGLGAVAEGADALVVLVPAVGDFVPEGAPLFIVHETGRSVGEAALRDSLVFGVERTIEQDPLLAFRWLVDIAIKALSPAINDPTTAVQCIDQIENLMRRVGTRRLATGETRDRSGALRLLQRTPMWESYVRLSFTEIRRFGGGSVQIQRRLRAVLEDLLDLVPEYRVAALAEQLELLDQTAGVEFSVAERGLATDGDYQGIGSPRERGRRRGVM